MKKRQKYIFYIMIDKMCFIELHFEHKQQHLTI